MFVRLAVVYEMRRFVIPIIALSTPTLYFISNKPHIIKVRKIEYSILVDLLNLCLKCFDFKFGNLVKFGNMEILLKGIVFVEFLANCPKAFGSYAFPQNFHTKKSVKFRYFTQCL